MDGPWRRGGRGGRGHFSGGPERGWQGGRGGQMRGGRGGQGRGRQQREYSRYRQEEREQPMGFLKMVRLMDTMDNEILLTVVDTSNGFDKELDLDNSNPRDHDRMLHKLELMARCCACESAPENTIQFLKMVNQSAMVKSGYINNFIMQAADSVELPNHRYSKGIVNLLTLMKTFFIRMPNSDFVSKAQLTLLAIQHLIGEAHAIVTDEVQILFTEIQSLKAQQQVKTVTPRIPSAGQDIFADDDDAAAPPNDFREMSVVPAVEDIRRNDETFLRVNKSQGKYENLDHYLDVQFRLLREDFVHPLRIGIWSHLEIKNGELPPGTKITDIRIYEDVYILGAICTGQGLAYRLRFNKSNTKKIRWENSKRLIYGSLVALSNNDFRTMYLCTVVNRNARDLAQGILEVQVEENATEFALLGPDISFTMAETTAYFESYRHVLTALKEIGQDFPFQRHIVRCNRAIAVPRYLQRFGQVKFDFRPLIPKNEDEADSATRRRYREVPVLETDEWPSAQRLDLDDSQYEALKHCLTKEFSLVQGPPGTGKTFLGLKVMQLLLYNWEKWHENQGDNDADEEPVLVVCYTNHALDQFLEGIKKITDKQIVRVGSRSQSEELKDCSLNNIRSDMKKQRRIPVALHSAFRRLQAQMSELQDAIHKSTCVIEGIDDNIVQLERLREVMDSDHLIQLNEFYYGMHDPLIEWLIEEDQAQWIYDHQGNAYYVHENNPADVLQNEAEMEEEHSDEEMDEEERGRLLDDDDRPEDSPEAKKKAESRQKLMQEVSQSYFVQTNWQTEVDEAQEEGEWQVYHGKKKKVPTATLR